MRRASADLATEENMDLVYPTMVIAEAPVPVTHVAAGDDRDFWVVLAGSLLGSAFALLAFDPALAGTLAAWAL
jgi:hypothetical protein